MNVSMLERLKAEDIGVKSKDDFYTTFQTMFSPLSSALQWTVLRYCFNQNNKKGYWLYNNSGKGLPNFSNPLTIVKIKPQNIWFIQFIPFFLEISLFANCKVAWLLKKLLFACYSSVDWLWRPYLSPSRLVLRTSRP